jgi:hypothetical protein
MPNARYFRDQAALCLEIAGHMSDRCSAESLRVAAFEHFARATELERADAENGRGCEAVEKREKFPLET